jgi:hypothetical protein
MAHAPNAFNLEVQNRRRAEYEATRNRAELDLVEKRWAEEDRLAEQAQTWQARQAADHERRLAYLEDVVENQVGRLVELAVGTLRKEIAAVEAKQLKFFGVHEPGRSYASNSMVVRKGGLWVALTATATAPGTDDTWQLAVKSGEPHKGPAIA